MVRAALTLASRCLVLYGSTELGGISASIVTDADNYHDYDVGHVLPGLEVRIVKLREGEEGEDEGEPLPVGEVNALNLWLYLILPRYHIVYGPISHPIS